MITPDLLTSMESLSILQDDGSASQSTPPALSISTHIFGIWGSFFLLVQPPMHTWTEGPLFNVPPSYFIVGKMGMAFVTERHLTFSGADVLSRTPLSSCIADVHTTGLIKGH